MKKILSYIIKVSALITSITAFSCTSVETVDRSFEIQVGESVKADTIRLISYNILEAMKLDKANNYDHFVAWVKKMNPDILALEEVNKVTQEQLEALALRWGHKYVVTNLKSDDNYPVALTSRYPIEVRAKIIENVSHGAIFANVRGVNIVVLHLWPQAYARGRETGAWAQDKSHDYDHDGDVDGDDYRLSEMNIFLDRTVRSYPTEPNWLMMGDFNSHSPLDAEVHSTARNYDVHNLILNSGFYYDMVRQMHSEFTRSTPTVYGGYSGISKGSRIDFIYGSKALTRDIVRAQQIYDEFTDYYSDHYPVLLDFRIYDK